jgi:hypothetical protein
MPMGTMQFQLQPRTSTSASHMRLTNPSVPLTFLDLGNCTSISGNRLGHVCMIRAPNFGIRVWIRSIRIRMRICVSWQTQSCSHYVPKTFGICDWTRRFANVSRLRVHETMVRPASGVLTLHMVHCTGEYTVL